MIDCHGDPGLTKASFCLRTWRLEHTVTQGPHANGSRIGCISSGHQQSVWKRWWLVLMSVRLVFKSSRTHACMCVCVWGAFPELINWGRKIHPQSGPHLPLWYERSFCICIAWLMDKETALSSYNTPGVALTERCAKKRAMCIVPFFLLLSKSIYCFFCLFVCFHCLQTWDSSSPASLEFQYRFNMNNSPCSVKPFSTSLGLPRHLSSAEKLLGSLFADILLQSLLYCSKPIA